MNINRFFFSKETLFFSKKYFEKLFFYGVLNKIFGNSLNVITMRDWEGGSSFMIVCPVEDSIFT